MPSFTMDPSGLNFQLTSPEGYNMLLAGDEDSTANSYYDGGMEVHEDEYAQRLKEGAYLQAFGADGLGGSNQWFKQYLDQGTQGVGNMTAAQMQNYARMQAAGFDPNQFMDQWLAAQSGIADVAMGASQPFGAALNQVAQRQAALGGEAALAAMPGGRNSGAGMAAFGTAYADPFAQAQVQQQGMMGNIYGNLSGQAMGQYGSNAQFGAGLQQQANQFNAQNQQDMFKTNAGFTQQAKLQNQMMENAMRDRQMAAGNMTSAHTLGLGNLSAGLAAEQNYMYQPLSQFEIDMAKEALEQGDTATFINFLTGLVGLIPTG